MMNLMGTMGECAEYICSLFLSQESSNESFRQMIPKNIRSVDSDEEVESEEEEREEEKERS
jgi:hypothetical protein